MLFERDHANPDTKHALEHARVLRAQFLRQLFSRKSNERKKSSATSFTLLHFFSESSRGFEECGHLSTHKAAERDNASITGLNVSGASRGGSGNAWEAG